MGILLPSIGNLSGKRVMVIGAANRAGGAVRGHLKRAGVSNVALVETNEDNFERLRDNQPDGLLLFARTYEPSNLPKILAEQRPEQIFVCGHPWSYNEVILYAIDGLRNRTIETMYLVPGERRARLSESAVRIAARQDFLKIVDLPAQGQIDEEAQYAEQVCNNDSDNPLRAVLDRKIDPPAGLAEFYRGKNALVTGGAGSLGQVVVARLKQLGAAHATVIDVNHEGLESLIGRYGETWLEAVPESPTYLENDLDAFLRRGKIDMVFHLSAIKLHPFAQSFPDTAFYANTMNTRNVVNAVTRRQIPHFLYTSSDKATWLRPANVLGQTRRLAEYYIQAAARENPERNFVITRFAHVLGSAGSLVTRRFIRQISQGLPITLTSYEAACPFMNMEEAADLILAAMMSGQNGSVFTVANLGRAVKMYDVARYLSKRMTGAEEYPIVITGRGDSLNVREGEPERKGPDSGNYGPKSQFSPTERPFVARCGSFSFAAYVPPVGLNELNEKLLTLQAQIENTADPVRIKMLLAEALDYYAKLQESQ